MKNNPLKIAGNITADELNELPLKTFEGKVILIQEQEKLSSLFDEINDHEVVGFDTETRPSFKKGERHKVSLMQIALPEKVYLIRLHHTGFSPTLFEWLEKDDRLKAGVGLRDDLQALQKIRHFVPGGFSELSTLAKTAGFEVESVRKLAGLLLGFRISKSAQTSNWEAPALSQKQIEYAATDAWVCLEIYKKLIAQPKVT